MTDDERDEVAIRIGRTLEENHAGHVVLRQAAMDFFTGSWDPNSFAARCARLVKAFEIHFQIDAPTAYSMHHQLKSCSPGTYSLTADKKLHRFFIHARMKEDDLRYDFIFTL